MDANKVTSLIKKGESQTLEFKQSFDREAIADYPTMKFEYQESGDGFPVSLNYEKQKTTQKTTPKITQKITRESGYEPPIICTPQELWEVWMMWNDKIVEEIHKSREEYLKKFNYDIHAVCKDIRKKTRDNDRRVVKPVPRPVKNTSRSA